ncbi:MAG TPA: phosphatidate cytidylyltransferase [Candidatus Nitrosotalea sp.]|nr:phosphatidate cytidylyltransferase [Candidatus Nitrosotalea sp.]
MDRDLAWIVLGAAGALVLATGAGLVLDRMVVSPETRGVILNMNARIRGWWVMCLTFLASLLTGGTGSVVLFALISVLALREFVTLAPTLRADHGALCWAFFGFIPLQYGLVAVGRLDLVTVVIPVIGALLLALQSTLAGDTTRFLERSADILWGLMVCVYAVSHVPALLKLEIPGYEGQDVKLLVFFVLVVQASDVLQYVSGKCLGRTAIAPTISPSKTWEGFVGGVVGATLLGAGLWWATPFSPWEAALLSLMLALLGFAGGLVMSAIKRDRGVKDYGALIQGHGGVLDRVDSICFAAPVFFHLTRWLVTR